MVVKKCEIVLQCCCFDTTGMLVFHAFTEAFLYGRAVLWSWMSAGFFL